MIPEIFNVKSATDLYFLVLHQFFFILNIKLSN